MINSTTLPLDSVVESTDAQVIDDDQNDLLPNLFDDEIDLFGQGDFDLITDDQNQPDGDEPELEWGKEGMGKTSVMIVIGCSTCVIIVFLYYIFQLVFKKSPRYFYDMDNTMDHLRVAELRAQQ